MILNYAKNQTALLLGGSTILAPEYFMIGTGSSTILNTQTELATAKQREAFTDNPTYPTSQKVQYTSDFSSVAMSGIQLTEFGLCGSASTITGSIWSRTVIPSITFDGSNELEIREIWEIV